MVFSSPLFLFGFLPVSLLLYYCSPGSIKNIILLFVSILFYAWGEVFYVGVMALSIISNYVLGLQIYRYRKNPLFSRRYLVLGLMVNLGLLITFKYTNFIAGNINELLSFFLPPIDIEPVHLPLGISFFTFQAISYIVDVYRKEVPPRKNIIDLSLYISLFPQLIAGPIVRYHDISEQIIKRSHSVELFSAGVQRFIYGLAKKMLIANPLGRVADSVFLLGGEDLTMPLAWIGVLAYTLQIYYDFSGYSDMAIGLGRMFGFTFLENFNYPYISRSLREFWRRWHISLSTWFRDYLYIPLGGSRVSSRRVYLNLLVVFCLTGFWHGASWNFLIWGLFHGVFLAAEHSGMINPEKDMWRPCQHLYLLSVVIIGWVFFRCETLAQALAYLYAMVDFSNFQTSAYVFSGIISHEALIAFTAGAVLSTPVYPLTGRLMVRVSSENTLKTVFLAEAPRVVILFTLLLFSILKTASSTYNPFIYFRF